MISKSELQHLELLITKGTPLPWWIDSHGHRMCANGGSKTVFVTDDRMGPATRHPETGNLSHWPNDWDASLVVEGINALPRLLAEIAELKAALAMTVQAVDELLPGISLISCRVGVINDALCTARPLVRED